MYIILECQTAGDGTVAVVPPVTRADWFEAQSTFHTAVSYAAISALPKHSVILTDEEGNVFDKKCYYHGVQPNDLD